MENQHFNKELLDYLYGEMEPSEKEAFERKLEVNLELKNEYEELVSVKKELENLKDKEVMEPFSAWGRSKISNQLQSGRRKRLIVFRPVTAIAASLVILMLVGFWTDFSLTVNSQGFYMGFSDQIELGTTDNLSEEDVQRLIETQLAQNNQKLAAQLAEARESYDDQLVAFGQELNRLKDGSAETSVSKDDIQELLRQTELSNTDLMKEYLRLTSNQQQQYFKEMLTQFNTFYRQQRENDMAVIQEHLLEINQQQALQKQETDQALARLFTRVSNN